MSRIGPVTARRAELAPLLLAPSHHPSRASSALRAIAAEPWRLPRGPRPGGTCGGWFGGPCRVCFGGCPMTGVAMNRLIVASCIALLTCLAAPARAVTIEQAMADPDWIGAPVESAYWSVDGRSVYYRIKQDGNAIRDLHRVDLAGGADTLVDPAAMANADGADAVFDRNRTRAAFVRNGDVFVREVASGRLIQLTRSPEAEAAPQFSADGRAVQYRVGANWFQHDLASGV